MDGLEVGEHAAQPAVVDVWHTNALGLGCNCFLGLLLGTDEEDVAAMGNGLINELVGRIDVGQCLLKINDVDAVAFRDDVALHLRIPTTGLVAKVDTGVKELTHGYNSHIFLGKHIGDA